MLTGNSVQRDAIRDLISQYFLHGVAAPDVQEVLVTFLTEHDLYQIDDSLADRVWKAQNLLLALDRGATEMAVYSRTLDPAPADILPYCSYETGKCISQLLQQKTWALVKESFVLLKANRKLLHPIALASALDVLEKEPILWYHFKVIAPDRVEWLAKMNDRWQWWLNAQGASDPLERSQLIWKTLFRQPIVVSTIQGISSDVWHAYFKFLDKYDLLASADVAEYLRNAARSRTIQQNATVHLIQLGRQPWSDEICDFALEFLQRNLTVSSQKIQISANLDWPVVLPISQDEFEHLPDHLEDWRYQILALTKLSTFLSHLERDTTQLAGQLMLDESLVNVAQVIILQAAQDPEEKHKYDILKAWLDHYPEHNTTRLKLQPLIQSISSASVAQLLQKLLKEEADDYAIERLTLLLTDIKCYLSATLSNKLCKTFIQAIERGVHQADKRNLKACLPNLKYRLDPRCFLILKQHWPDDALYFSDLNKPFWTFRETLEQRYELFQYISDEI